MKTRIAVAVSGKGRSLANLIAKAQGYEVAAVISSRPDAPAVAIAERHGLPVHVQNFREPDAEALETWLQSLKVEWIALAGFLKVFPTLPAFATRVVNIHPALLPAFGGHGMYGMKVHEAVFAAQAPRTGATVHFVNENYDEGAIIAQAAVETRGLASPEAIAEAVFEQECRLYPAALSRLCAGDSPAPGKIWQLNQETQLA